MYVLRQPADGAGYMLYEMTPAELRAAQRERGDSEYPRLERLDASRAHRWVREGGVHSTYLYVEDGRIRRARDS